MMRTTCPKCNSVHIKSYPSESLCLKCGTYFDPFEGLYGQDLGEAILHSITIEEEITAWERGDED